MIPIIVNEGELEQARIISLGSEEVVYLNNNEITITKSRVRVLLGSGSNQLHTINGGQEGTVLILKSPSLVVIDNTGNLRLSNNFTMDHRFDTLTLIKDGNNWIEIARSNNA